MAAVMNVIKRTLSVAISRGEDADGNPVSKSYTYSNVKPDATPAGNWPGPGRSVRQRHYRPGGSGALYPGRRVTGKRKRRAPMKASARLKGIKELKRKKPVVIIALFARKVKGEISYDF